ncbi:tetratricopeptide repeat protein [Dactylosporangium sp. NPDC049140]|uniref:tetratricopeptide repeat protein n=1 Tax=Dactylosporangium sp. NPDC049140 TaxID=3155647 RepID=UPI00340D1DA7
MSRDPRRAPRPRWAADLARLAVPVLLIIAAGAAVAWFADERRRAVLVQVRESGLVVLEVAGVLLLLVLAVGLIVWLGRPPGITFDSSLDGADLDGTALARALAGELHRVRSVHEVQGELKIQDSSRPPVVLNRRDTVADSVLTPAAPARLADAVVGIGSVELAGATLPVGSLLAALRHVWPLRRSGPSISGQVFRQGRALRLTVQLRPGRRAAPVDFSVLTICDDVRAGRDELLRTAAARIAHTLSPGAAGITWQGFARLTRALEQYQEYDETADPAVLESAVLAARGIPARDEHSRDVRALVYNLGVACLAARDLRNAQRLLERAHVADPADAVIRNALAVTYFEQRRFAEARAAFEEARGLVPSALWDGADVEGVAAHPWNGLGNTYVELADYTSAIQVYQEAIERWPAAAYLYNGLGNAYLQQHQWDEAERAYRAAVERDPDSAYPLHGLGNLRARRGRFEEAEEYHEQALERDPAFAHAWNGLGEALAGRGRHVEALDKHRRAVELRPDDPYTWCSLGLTHLRHGDVADALEALHRARDLDERAAYVRRGLGDAYLRLGSWDEARDAYREAVDANPADAAAWDGLARATGAQGKGDLKRQVALFEKAAEANPTEPFGWNQLGDACYRAGLLAESVEAHLAALELDPKNSFAQDGLGKAHLGLGNFDAAERAHREAEKINPRDAYAPHGVAAVHLARGEFEAALEENRRAIVIEPRADFAWNGLGDAAERLRRYDEAEMSFRTTLEISPDNAYAHTGLARVALARGRAAEALATCARAATLPPPTAFAYITLGDAHAVLGEHDRAIEAYREGLVLDQRRIDGWAGLGHSYVWLGDFVNALGAFDQGLEVRPEHWRLLLGRGDVLLRKEAEREDVGDFGPARALYEAAVRAQPDAALAPQVRLAALAVRAGDLDAARRHAGHAQRAFQRCWDLRRHSDADLGELRTLATMLAGPPEEARQGLRRLLRGGAVPGVAVLPEA